MFEELARVLLGDVARAAELPTEAEVRAVYGCGRPPRWLAINKNLTRNFNGQAPPVKPFFNHDRVNTELKSAA